VTPRSAAETGDRLRATEEDHIYVAVRVSDELEGWFNGDGDKTLGGLIAFFGEKSFALLFVVLMATPALPLPTGGATHVFEVVVILLAIQLIGGRDHVWLPRRWHQVELAGPKQMRVTRALLRLIRFLERFSKPRLTFTFGSRLSNVAFGLLVTICSVAAFLAPPFSGLDTLPSLGVVFLSLGVLLEDFYVVIAALVIGAVGIALEIVLGAAAIRGIGDLI
jgi:hypothetical protein